MTQIRQLLPGPAVIGELRDGSQDVLDRLADLYAYPAPAPERGWVRVNVVSSLDGASTGYNGRSSSVSGPTDRVIFSVLRGLADVVLVGAGTARVERYRAATPRPEFADRRSSMGQLPAPVLAVVTYSGNLPLPNLLSGPAPTCILTCASANLTTLRSRFGSERVIVVGEQAVEPAEAIAHLASLGLRRILCEGGPTLLGTMLSGNLLDELCLSWSPVMVGGSGARIAHGFPASLRLSPGHLLEAEGSLFGRWLVQPS